MILLIFWKEQSKHALKEVKRGFYGLSVLQCDLILHLGDQSLHRGSTPLKPQEKSCVLPSSTRSLTLCITKNND